MSRSAIVLPLPCGCVAAFDGRPPLLMECGWCGAVFARGDFEEWVSGALIPEIHLTRSHDLVQFGPCVLEVRGRCDECEAPLVREAGKSVTFHLHASGRHMSRVVN